MMEIKNFKREASISSGQFLKQKEYWLNKLSGDLMISHFPQDFNKIFKNKDNDRILNVTNGHVKFQLEEELFYKLISAANQSDTRLFILLVTGLILLLHKYSGQEDVIVGAPIEKQTVDGELINTILALRNFVSDNMTFKELLFEVRQTVVDALENQNYPLETIHQELNIPVGDNDNFSLFQVGLLLENMHDKSYISHLKLDMLISFIKKNDCIEGKIEYDSSLYEMASIERICKYFCHLLQKALFNPGVCITELDVMEEEERNYLVEELNNTGVDYPRHKTIHELFEDQVEKKPGHIAVEEADTGHTMTYKELNRRANRLANLLQEKGVVIPGAVVAVMGERTGDIVTSILAILKAGGVFLPLDAQNPDERLHFILEDSGVYVFISQEQIIREREVLFNAFSPGIIIAMDDEGIYNDNSDEQNPCNVIPPTDPAYIIYTSGTTGKPKGVIVEHRSLVNYIQFAKTNYVKDESVNFPLYTSIAFDLTITSIFTPLVTGNAVVVYSGWNKGNLIERIVDDNKVGIVKLTPSHLYLIGEKQVADLSHKIKRFVVGGEVLKYQIARDIINNFNGKVEIYNEYGPTEATVGCMLYKFDPVKDKNKGSSVSIGIPASNTQIYLLDKNREPVSMGAIGEIHIGGDGLARGYLNRPELTSEKFLNLSTLTFSKSFCGAFFKKRPAGGYLYRTGDLARWMSDGNIEFLGRIDHQVKIRGFRIELGEIESQLLKHEEVNKAVVIIKESVGNTHICAYIVSGKELNVSELREYLAGELPDYMVPSYFVRLNAIPLTPNGKVDVKALPEPETKTEAVYVAPRDETEKKLVAIWSEILGLNTELIGIDSNFFELGGHSLSGTVLNAKLHKAFNVKLALVDLFRLPTVRGLSQLINNSTKMDFISIEPVEEKEYYPLSSAQERLFIIHQMDPNSIGYNVPMVYKINGRLIMEKLQDVFRKLIHRHDNLRTSFILMDDKPVQEIHKNVEFEMDYFDVTGVGTSHLQESENQSIINRFIRPFDFSRAPLLRVGLIKTDRSGERFILMMDIHHIITDGVSMDILVKEMGALYVGHHLTPLKLHYKDFSEWQNSVKIKDEMKKQEAYWLKQFEGEIPVLELPTDFQRPLLQSFEGDSIHFELDNFEVTGLRELATAQGITLFMVILSLYNIFLSKISGQEDIIVGTPIAGRRHTDLEHIMGIFINTLALRNYPNGEKSFLEFLHEIKINTLGAYENQEYQYEDLVTRVAVSRDISRNPLVDIMFALNNVDMQFLDIPKFEIPDLKIIPYKSNFLISKVDMLLDCIDNSENISFALEYSTKLFKKETILGFLRNFKQVILSALANPGQKIWEIEILSNEERKHLLFDFNDTVTDYPVISTINQLFEAQVERFPDNIAVVSPSTGLIYNALHITYKELNEKANRLAYVLRGKSIESGTIVSIKVERSIEMIIGVLGILKSGGAYLPIDPDYPEERINFMLRDSDTILLVTNDKEDAKVGRWEVEKLFFEEIFKSPNSSSYHRTLLPSSLLNSSEVAYVIYTSGSTGKPKGVMIAHSSVVNLLYAMQNQYPLEVSDTYLLKTSYIFDVSVTELFGWYMGGSKLAVLEKNGHKDPRSIVDSIEKNRVTHINFVPSMFNAFIEHVIEKDKLRLSSLKYIFLAGEVLLPDLVEKFRGLYPDIDINLENIYGPTESTVYSSKYSLNNWNGIVNIPIGIPLPNIKLYILSKYNYLQPIGISGELYIGGAGLARGYLNNPELTAEKFIHFHHSSFIIHHSKLYRTGDLARWLPDGNIEFLGRIDHQVKIRGYRIELGEIESLLLTHDNIKETVMSARKDKDGNTYLCCYFVSVKEFTISELRSYLSAHLPDYMIPAYFIPLEKIPLTANGKIDRKNLPELRTIALGSDAVYESPRNEIEKIMAAIWSDVLGINTVSINDNFFAIGGDSIKSIQIISRLKKVGYLIEMKDIFLHPHILDLGPLVKRIEPIQEQTIINYNSCIDEKEVNQDNLTYPDISLDIFKQLQEKYSYLIQDIYTLSPMQEMMLFYALYEDKNKSLYFLQGFYQINEELNLPLFERSFNELIKRHDILRTVFIHEGLDRPLQVVLKERNVEFYFEDLRQSTPILARKNKFILNFREKDRQRSFNLSKDVLMRVAVFQLADAEYQVVWSSHHILMDGWSMGILISELSEIYAAHIENRTIQLPDVKPYRNYIQWLENQQKNDIKYYWKKYLDSYEEIATIPRTKKWSLDQGYKSAGIGTRLEKDKADRLNKLGARNHVTMNIMFQVVWGIVLSRYSNKRDVVFGSIVSGRPSIIDGVESMVGCFINTIPVRFTFEENTTFSELLRISQSRAIESEFYHYFSLAEIQAESVLKQQLLDHVIEFQNFPVAEKIKVKDYKVKRNEKTETIELENLNIFEQVGNYNFYINIVPREQISLFFSYNANLYDRELIEKLGTNCIRVLDQIIENEEITISNIAILSEDEKRKLLFEFNDNRADFHREKTVYHMIEEHAEIAPDKIAVIGHIETLSSTSVSYRELNRGANQLARMLRANGIQKDEPVGILMGRTEQMVESILAVWKAGGAFIPLDTAYPIGRITDILRDSSAKVLITWDIHANSQLEKEYDGKIVKLEYQYTEMSRDTDYQAVANLDLDYRMSRLAYVIYTSGSTGKPKGVMIEHIGMMNHIQAKINDLQLAEKSIVAQNATHTFDISVWQFFVALTLGGRTVIYPNELILDPEKFLSRMNRDQITILEVVPSYLSVLLESTSVFPLSLQYLLVTGEEIKPFLVKKWFEKYPGIKMVNAYGPTEASDDITHYIMDKAPDMERIPIGKPVQNMNIYIVDNNMQLCPIGVKGEICVAGVGVGRGYLGDEEKTKQFFMEDPFVSPIPNESTSSVTNDHSPSPLTTQHSPIATHRLYKTGDLGCWLPDGNIEFFGRKDYQVKIRGFRIELGEIEEKLLRHPEIKEAVVVDKEDTLGNKYLCAYIVAHSVNLPDVTELKQYLSGSLPEYMIPAYFVSLGKIPLTSNGKIDRKALPAFDEIGNAHKYVAPTNPIEEKLVEIWIEVLDKDRGTIGIEHNFFDLGGHSLKAVVLVSKIHKEFDVRIPLIEVFRAPVIRELSHYIEMAIKDRFASIEPVEKKEYYTLSSAQKRLYIEQQMDLEGSTYSLPQIIVFNDRPNKTRLEETFQKLIARHENLRTSFHLINDVPFQKIHEHVEFAIDDFETDEKRAREVAERYQRTFDLSKAPLLKAALFNIEQKQYVLLIVIHHIITDAISYSLLKEDFQALYEGKPLPDLTLQYKDYSEWQNSPNQQERIKKQEVYWLKEFSGDIPLLNLFTDYARPAILDTGGRGISFTIEKKELEGLRGLAAEEGVTMFMLLLALLNILLSKFSGQEDILVGTPSAGRFHSDLEKIIGMFVNTLVLRNKPAADYSFVEFLKKVKEQTLLAFDNQEYQYEELVRKTLKKRELNRNPLFDVMFQLFKNASQKAGLNTVYPQIYDIQAVYDLAIQGTERKDAIILNLSYRTCLFKEETIKRLIESFREIAVIVIENKETKLKDIKISQQLLDKKLALPQEEGDFVFQI